MPLQRPFVVSPALFWVAVYAAGPVLAQATAPAPVTGDQVVSTFEQINGVHAGQRRNHVKGVCASGEFIGTPAAAALSRSELFAGQPVPVVARFSLAGGNPGAPDNSKAPRGMALQFKLPSGDIHHITMLNVPVFGAATPQTFLDGLVAQLPDPGTGKPDAAKVQAFRASHPDTLPLAQYLATHNPPAGYQPSSYWGIHTFQFIDKAGKVTLVRWRFAPQGGERTMADEDLRAAGPQFLDRSLSDALKQAPARWDMVVSLGEPEDARNNATQPWPAERKTFVAGTLTLSKTDARETCELINFNPLIMTDGVAPTNDPVLMFRAEAYAASYVKRFTGR